MCRSLWASAPGAGAFPWGSGFLKTQVLVPELCASGDSRQKSRIAGSRVWRWRACVLGVPSPLSVLSHPCGRSGSGPSMPLYVCVCVHVCVRVYVRACMHTCTHSPVFTEG